jgi:hypothetical protein
LKQLLERISGVLADSDDTKGQIWQMIGEFLRELGVLVIVFYPIERRIAEAEYGPAKVVFVGLMCVISGIVVERRR